MPIKSPAKAYLYIAMKDWHVPDHLRVLVVFPGAVRTIVIHQKETQGASVNISSNCSEVSPVGFCRRREAASYTTLF